MVSLRASADKVLRKTTAGDVLGRKIPAQALGVFRSMVWKYWKKNGRHNLRWRKTKDPYKILVSEVMLQQTQVPRVMEKYKEFLKMFPNVRSLARAPLSDVLKVWSGMGYNRRAKYLRDAAKVIVERHNGKVPRAIVLLRTLPGIGPYTASAVRVFAFNQPDFLVETNIRAAFIHHFFPYRGPTYVNLHRSVLGKKVSDTDLLVLIQKAASGQDPKKWNWALMDYGSHIKKLHKNPSRQSEHYTKQPKFEGSLRQIRGAVLRALYKGPTYVNELLEEIHRTDLCISMERLDTALAGLERDGLIEKKKGKWWIA